MGLEKSLPSWPSSLPTRTKKDFSVQIKHALSYQASFKNHKTIIEMSFRKKKTIELAAIKLQVPPKSYLFKIRPGLFPSPREPLHF